MIRILAIDQASVSGFAVVDGTGEVLDSGSVSFKGSKDALGESRGMIFLRFAKWIREKMDAIQKEATPCATLVVVHEKTLMFGHLTNTATADIAAGFKAIMEACAAEMLWQVTSVNPCTLKKWATGSGKADKALMMKSCEMATGINPIDDNHADAVLIGLWAAQTLGFLDGERQANIARILTPPVQKKPRKRTK